MIRKLIHRVLGRKTDPAVPAVAAVAAKADAAAVIPAGRHGINRERLTSGARRTVEGLQQSGYKAYVVGGAVRDLLAGIPPKDFDVATDATPEQVRQCFRRSRLIGRRFQIVHVLMGAETIEVATFRGPHDGNTLTDEHGRVLRDNVFGTHAEDAARRDFTVNALYYDPVAETIVDFHHGVADLEQKTLRVIGDPVKRFREDPVRMLRAVRLAAKLKLSIDPAARRPIRELTPLMENVPPARLFDETLKLLTSGHALRCLQQLREEGLHHGLLPLLDVILEQPLGKRFVILALENTDQRVRDGKPVSPSFLFATLLWDQTVSSWKKLEAAGERSIPALFAAMDQVLDAQSEKLAITRRIAGDIKEIWGLQPRFEQRSGKRPYALLEHPRFRAAWDFLQLRCEAGEIDAEITDWWQAFLDADGESRAELLQPPRADEVKKRRRRRRKPAAGSQPADGSTPGS